MNGADRENVETLVQQWRLNKRFLCAHKNDTLKKRNENRHKKLLDRVNSEDVEENEITWNNKQKKTKHTKSGEKKNCYTKLEAISIISGE